MIGLPSASVIINATGAVFRKNNVHVAAAMRMAGSSVPTAAAS